MEKTSSVNPSKSYLIPTLIIGVLFFIFGFITWINGTLIPYLEVACELTPSQAILVTFASYIAYAVMAFPSSWVLKIVGFKNGMIYGLLVMALGALIFIPAAYTRFYGLFLTGLFVIGIGLALLQTAANPYITILGPIESAARRISVMGICNKGAGAIAPLIMGSLLLTGMERFQHLANLPLTEKNALLQELASRIVVPYIIIALAFVVLAIAIRLSSLPDIRREEDTNPVPEADAGRKSIFDYPYLWLGFITLFLYVGVEVLAGDTIQLYGNTGLGIPLAVARHFTTYTMLGMLGGYLLGIILIPKIISQSKVLVIAAFLGILLSIGVVYGKGSWSVNLPFGIGEFQLNWSITFLALLGFINAPMWPAIWPLSIDGLGKFLKTGSALLIVAIGGGAILPKIWTMIGEANGIGMQKAFWMLIPCYVFILFFAVKGHKIGRKKAN